MKTDLMQWGGRMTVTLVFVLFFILSGCGFHTVAHMRHSPDLMEQYREKTLSERLSYFYCGRENLPDAVVGVDPAYAFESKFWFPIEFGPNLYHKIDHLSNLEPGQNKMYARTIIGPAGNTVGVWFSFYHSTGVVVDEANHKIKVFNPYKPETRQYHMYQ